MSCTHRNQRRGLSLVECLIAFFLLTSAILVVIQLFHSARRYQTTLQTQARALLLASSTLAELRNWASSPANFASPWADQTWVDATTGFTVSQQSGPTRSLDTPCQLLEAPWIALGNGRRLTTSLIPVRIRVSWNPANPQSQVQLVSFVGEPERTAQATLEITPIAPSALAAGATQVFSVQAKDSLNNNLNDLTFNWAIEPITGNAMFEPNSPRDGRSITLKHEYQSYNLPPQPRPGTINISCWTRYRGQTLKGLIGPVTLL